MATKLAYVDESYNDSLFCLSALIIDSRDRADAMSLCVDFRRRIREAYGIKVRSELHSQPLVRGQGRKFATRLVSRYERSRVFAGMLWTAASLPGVQLINVALKRSGRRDAYLDAWDRLLNRLERNAQITENRDTGRLRICLEQARDKLDQRTIDEVVEHHRCNFLVVADEGHEFRITRAFRKMHRYNMVPSVIGRWESGQYSKNQPLSHFIEEPVFRDSASSHLLQLVDAVAFALLKRETPPTSNVKKYGIDKMFDQYLRGVCLTAASKYDPLGIVRH